MGLKSRLNYLFSGNTDGPQFLTDQNWEKSKSTCIHKSKQILYMC